MLARLTLKLAALPESGWPRFAAACAQEEPMPPPTLHAAAVAGVSVLATALGAALRSGSTTGGVLLHALAALLGYAGGALLVVQLTGRWVEVPRAREALVARFASGAALPVLLSGAINVLPLVPMAAVLGLAGAALSLWSGWVGASALLGLEDAARKRAALVPALLAGGPVVLAALVRLGLPA